MIYFTLMSVNFYIRNAIIWVVYLLYVFLVFILNSKPVGILSTFLILLFNTGVFGWIVIHNRILISNVLLKGRAVLYLCCLVPALGCWFLLAWQLAPMTGYPFSPLRETILFVVNTTLGALFFLSARYFQERRALDQLMILNRDIELQQLRSQLQPHFLFNALNNIYSYTLHHNRYGNELILRLSELMQFILGSSDKDRVPVEEEIRFIENYIAFEKERLGERCTIKFQNTIRHPEKEIAPMILIPFVENAFKYGASTVRDTAIDINVRDTEKEFELEVKNTIAHHTFPPSKKGHINAMRCLELIYPQRHSLSISEGGSIYIVRLKIAYEQN